MKAKIFIGLVVFTIMQIVGWKFGLDLMGRGLFEGYWLALSFVASYIAAFSLEPSRKY